MDLKGKILDLLEHIPYDNYPWSFEEGRHTYADELAERIFMMCQEEVTEAMMYFVSEIHFLKDKVSELEMEVMLAEESFDAQAGTNYGVSWPPGAARPVVGSSGYKTTGAKLNIKKRSNFKNEK